MVAILLGVLGGAGAAVVTGVAAAPIASAAPVSSQCDYGSGTTAPDGGKDASGLCLFDWTNFSQAAAEAPGGQQFTLDIGSGYTATYTVTESDVAGLTNPGVLGETSAGSPNGGVGVCGSSGTQFDEAAPGDPRLYTNCAGLDAVAIGGVTIDISNFSVTDAAGRPVTGYTLVVQDAEVSQYLTPASANGYSDEGLVYTSDEPLTLFDDLSESDQPSNGGAGFGCPSLTPPGIGTTQVTCDPTPGVVGYAEAFQAVDATSIGATLTTASRQGVAFGIETAQVTLDKTVTARSDASDSFGLSTVDPQTTTVGSGSTGTGNTATTGPVTVIPETGTSDAYTLSETSSTGDLAAYDQSWACSNSNAGSATVLPSGSGTSQTVAPAVGDDITCTVTNTPVVDLSVTKSVDASPYVPGQKLTYTVTVKNSGPANALGATVSDPLPAALAGAGFTWTCTATSGSSCTASGSGDITDTVDVAAGGTLTYTVTGTVPSGVQGTLDNTATVTPPSGTSDAGCSPDCSSSVTDHANPTVDLAVTKTSSPNPYVAGQPVTYTVKVTNSGPSDAVDAKVSDPLPAALQGAGFTWTCAATSGSSCTASGSGDITDTVDVAAGGTLTYTVTGTVPAGTTSELDNTATVTPPPGSTDPNCTPNCAATNKNPPTTVDLAVKKTASPDPYVPGDRLTYTVTVTNGGPDTATDATVSDPLPAALAGAGFTWTCAPSTGASCSASGSGDITDTVTIPSHGQLVYTVTGTVPAGVEGTLVNTATATPPTGDTDPGCAPDCTSRVTDPPNPEVDLSVTKTSTPDPYAPGSPLTYTVTVTNGGPSDAIGATVSDPLPAALQGAGFTWTCVATSGSSCTASGSGNITDTVDVAVGGTLSYTITGTVPKATTGTLDNTATVTPPTGSTDPGCTPDCTSKNVNPASNPELSIKKIADASDGDNNPIKVGEKITYSYVVTNTGNVPLTDVSVSDPTLGAVTCPSATLAVGASETCKADEPHVVTQTDVDAGKVTDTATATGTPPQGPPTTSPPSTVTVPSNPKPSVSIVKSARVTPAADQGGVKVGDTIAYSYRVTNTGNVTLESVHVDDPTIGTVTCPTPTAPGLAPGASEVCTADATHKVTQADVDAGKVIDTATATGTDTQGKTSPPSPPSTVTVPATPAKPSVSLVKTATVSPATDQSAAKAGDTITYSFQVTNTGNVTLKSVHVDDPTGGAVSCPVPSAPGLAPGASETCTGASPHVVTRSDVKAGKVVDTATATGTDTQGKTSPPSAPSTATVTTAAAPTSTAPSSPEQPLTSIITGHGLWGPGGPTGRLWALAGAALLALGGLGLVALHLRRKASAF